MTQDEKQDLWWAAAKGDEAAVKAALAAEPGLATESFEHNYQPTTVMTMLHVAASRDHVGVMQLLLAAGADPMALAPPLKGRMTPLHCAGRGTGAAVKLLLDVGADPNAYVKRGTTPLYGASYNGNVAGVRLLLDAGANPEGKPASAVPLMAAAMESQVGVIDLLLSAGAKVTRKDNKKSTALHHAAHRGDVAVNRYLLEQGLDPDQPNKKGETPRAMAAKNLWSDNREALVALYNQQ